MRMNFILELIIVHLFFLEFFWTELVIFLKEARFFDYKDSLTKISTTIETVEVEAQP